MEVDSIVNEHLIYEYLWRDGRRCWSPADNGICTRKRIRLERAAISNIAEIVQKLPTYLYANRR